MTYQVYCHVTSKNTHPIKHTLEIKWHNMLYFDRMDGWRIRCWYQKLSQRFSLSNYSAEQNWLEKLLYWKTFTIFSGYIDLHDQFSNKKNKHSQSYIWGTSIVETTLQSMIDLWYLQNEEVYGKTANDKEQKHKSWL